MRTYTTTKLDLLQKTFFIQVNCNNKELRYIAPKVWSKVPDDLKEENSLSSFCTKLKIELMKDYCD